MIPKVTTYPERIKSIVVETILTFGIKKDGEQDINPRSFQDSRNDNVETKLFKGFEKATTADTVGPNNRRRQQYIQRYAQAAM